MVRAAAAPRRMPSPSLIPPVLMSASGGSPPEAWRSPSRHHEIGLDVLHQVVGKLLDIVLVGVDVRLVHIQRAAVDPEVILGGDEALLSGEVGDIQHEVALSVGVLD